MGANMATRLLRGGDRSAPAIAAAVGRAIKPEAAGVR